MSENKLEDLIDDVGDGVYDTTCEIFDEYVKEHTFKTHRDYAPYGDTEVEVCQYVTDEDQEEFREETEKEITVDDVIDKLKQDPYFRSSIEDMIQYVCWNRDIDV